MTDLKDMPKKVWVSDSIATNGLGIQVCSIKPNNTFPRPQTAYIRADLVERGWKPIEKCPDGRSVLIITRIALSDGKFYQPKVAYRNGCYWFYGPGDRVFAKPTHYMELPQPPKDEAQS